MNIRVSNMLAEFKCRLLAVIRPIYVYVVLNVTGIKNLTKLCETFSPLNQH